MGLRRAVDQRQQRRVAQITPTGGKAPEAPDYHVVQGDERPAGDRTVTLFHFHLAHSPLFPMGVRDIATRALPINSHRSKHVWLDEVWFRLDIAEISELLTKRS